MGITWGSFIKRFKKALMNCKKRLLYFTVQQPFFSLFFTFCRSPAPPFPAIPVHGAALLMRFFLALDMGPGPTEALIFAAPFDQRIEREGQAEEVQQSVQQGIQRDERIQCTDHRHHTACLQEEQAILAAVFLKVFGLDGTAALIAPDTGIFHDRVAVKDHHQAKGELKAKNIGGTSCVVG